MKNIFESSGEFLNDVQEALDVLKNKGIKEAEPLAKKIKEKYAKGAMATKGAECSGCASCAGCIICGPTAIAAIQVGHGLQLFHCN
jgi:hypothetical protein